MVCVTENVFWGVMKSLKYLSFEFEMAVFLRMQPE